MDRIKNIVEITAVIMTGIVIVKWMIRTSQILQQNQYRIPAFLKFIKRFYINNYYNIIIYVTLFLFIFLDNVWIQVVYIIALGSYYYLSKTKDIVKLKYTGRIIRLWILHLALVTTIYTFLMLEISFTSLLQVLLICLILTPIHLLIAHILMIPIEKVIAYYYLKKAKIKLALIKPKVIAITGSYGKTTTKNILYEILATKNITVASPKSYNTLMGLSLTINNYTNKNTELLVLEMGATHVGDIEKLVKFVQPEYTLITEIGPQHLETFKTIDNIVKEKFAIVNSDKHQILVVNNDNHYIKDNLPMDGVNVVTVGLNEENDFFAKNIQYSSRGLSFDICFKNDIIPIKTSLLGRHNIYNILLSVALIKSIGEFNHQFSNQEISFIIENIKPVPHRLAPRMEDGWLILDDSFNSNNQGFLNALEVLKETPNPRILITPGIVEMGSLEYETNFNLANKVISTCDFVYLVDNVSARAIEDGFVKLGFKNYKVVNSFKDAYQQAKASETKGAILIENDLTDNLIIRR